MTLTELRAADPDRASDFDLWLGAIEYQWQTQYARQKGGHRWLSVAVPEWWQGLEAAAVAELTADGFTVEHRDGLLRVNGGTGSGGLNHRRASGGPGGGRPLR